MGTADRAPGGRAATDEASRAEPTPKRRADAQRNVDALLEAAKTVFATSGVDAPVRTIAAEAGVGVGTVYRHFPVRAELVAAVFRREVDACAAEAPALAERHDPATAVQKWLLRYTEFLATKRGLAAALHSGDPAFEPLPGYFDRHLGPALESLLEAARADGSIRADVDARDLLHAVRNLSITTPGDTASQDLAERMVNVLIDGLRTRAGSTDR